MKESYRSCNPWEQPNIVDRAKSLGISPKEFWTQYQLDPLTRERTGIEPTIPFVNIEDYLPKEELERITSCLPDSFETVPERHFSFPRRRKKKPQESPVNLSPNGI